MVISELQNSLQFLHDKVKTKGFILYLKRKHLRAFLRNKASQIDIFKKEIQIKWNNHHQEIKNYDDTILYINFFNHHFNEIFLFFVDNILGLEKTSFELSHKEKLFQSTLLFEYKYYMPLEEEECIDEFFNRYGDQKYICDYYVGFFFSLFSALGILIKQVLSEHFYAFLDHTTLKFDESGKYWHFSIIVKDSKNELRNNYFKTSLINIFKQIKGIPKKVYDEFFKKRKELYKRVLLDYYGDVRKELKELMRFFLKKTTIIQNLSPLLDIFNFVCSRVEDTYFDKIDVIKNDYLESLNYSFEKKRSLIKFFRFIDFNSTLYTTFSSNNLPSPKAQFDLFLLYVKYYLSSGLDALEGNDLLFSPEKFSELIRENNKTKNNKINAKTIDNINLFLDYFSYLNNFDENHVFIEEIFGKDISTINFWFFNGFLNSFNQKFLEMIDKENERLSEMEENDQFTFDIVMNHLCNMLFVLIEKIFLGSSLEEVSKHFIDPRGRYIPPNIAMRVKELFFFLEMNFSDDLWPYFIISFQKKAIIRELSEYVSIPKNFFYTNTDLAKFLIYNNFKSYSNPQILEEWLLKDIIVPLNEFVLKFQDHPKDIALHESLLKVFLKSSSVKDDISDQVKLVCKKIAPYWETLNNS